MPSEPTKEAREAAEALFHHKHDIPYSEGNARQVARALDQFAEKWREKVKRQAEELTNQGRVIAERSKQLDAMHWVWCSGGCKGGTHQKNPDLPPLTRELVETAVRNTERLVTRFGNIEFRKLPIHEKHDFHTAIRERDDLRRQIRDAIIAINADTVTDLTHAQDGTLRMAMQAHANGVAALRRRVGELEGIVTRQEDSVFRKIIGDISFQLTGDENASARDAVDALQARAERAEALRELLIAHGGWMRDDGRTFLTMRVADGADLSCRATREDALNNAIEEARRARGEGKA